MLQLAELSLLGNNQLQETVPQFLKALLASMPGGQLAAPLQRIFRLLEETRLLVPPGPGGIPGRLKLLCTKTEHPKQGPNINSF